LKMKACLQCGEAQDLSSYYKHNRMADGYLNICKVCISVQRKQHRAANLEKLREYDRARASQPARVAQLKARSERHRSSPERARANWAVGNAVRDGRLQRPDNCSECGVPCIPDGHHEDYSKPLEVRWLCRSCHNKAHAPRPF
jgi:hypothetical protein